MVNYTMTINNPCPIIPLVTVTNFITDLHSTIAGASTELFSPLTDPTIITLFKNLVENLLNNDMGNANYHICALSLLGVKYKLIELDETIDKTYESSTLGFIEAVLPGNIDYKGWGSALIRNSGARKIVYQAPHIFTDLYSDKIALHAFKTDPDSCALITAGTRRDTNAIILPATTSISDVTRYTNNLFHVITEFLAIRGQSLLNPYFFIQMHGAANDPLEPDITLSNGVSMPVFIPTTHILLVKNALSITYTHGLCGIPGPGHPSGVYALCGGANMQGNMLESMLLSDYFIHIEPLFTIRDTFNSGGAPGLAVIEDLLLVLRNVL